MHRVLVLNATYEPLNVLHRPGVMRARAPYWYIYIPESQEAPYLPAFHETLVYRYHLLAELLSLRSVHDAGRMARDLGIFLRGRLRRQRPLLKDPFAIFSIPWFVRRLDSCVVVTVRHPAGFASSLKRLNWPCDFRHEQSGTGFSHVRPSSRETAARHFPMPRCVVR